MPDVPPRVALLVAGALWHVAIIWAVFRLDLGAKHQRRRERPYQYDSEDFATADDDR